MDRCYLQSASSLGDASFTASPPATTAVASSSETWPGAQGWDRQRRGRATHLQTEICSRTAHSLSCRWHVWLRVQRRSDQAGHALAQNLPAQWSLLNAAEYRVALSILQSVPPAFIRRRRTRRRECKQTAEAALRDCGSRPRLSRGRRDEEALQEQGRRLGLGPRVGLPGGRGRPAHSTRQHIAALREKYLTRNYITKRNELRGHLEHAGRLVDCGQLLIPRFTPLIRIHFRLTV